MPGMNSSSASSTNAAALPTSISFSTRSHIDQIVKSLVERSTAAKKPRLSASPPLLMAASKAGDSDKEDAPVSKNNSQAASTPPATSFNGGVVSHAHHADAQLMKTIESRLNLHEHLLASFKETLFSMQERLDKEQSGVRQQVQELKAQFASIQSHQSDLDSRCALLVTRVDSMQKAVDQLVSVEESVADKLQAINSDHTLAVNELKTLVTGVQQSVAWLKNETIQVDHTFQDPTEDAGISLPERISSIEACERENSSRINHCLQCVFDLGFLFWRIKPCQIYFF